MATLTGALGVARDEQKGAKLIRDACEKDKSLLACSQLAMLELQGVGPIQKDPAAARRRADEACTGGYPPACTLVGTLLLHGTEGREPAQAARYFEKACEQGDGSGCALEGAQLVDGDGIARDRTRGLQLIKNSCERMNAHQGCAMYARALMLGSEGHKGLGKGVNLAETLCAQGELNSCLLAAAGYIEGRGVEKDLERGARFLVVACQAGLEPACKLEKRLPADLVSKVEQQTSEAIAQAAAAHSARAIPSGLPSFLPQPGP
jgi:TPR repeat protein